MGERMSAGGIEISAQGKGRSFLTLFPRLKPVLLRKDVGSIPFFLAAESGWRASLAFFEQSDCTAGQLAGDAYGRSVALLPLGPWGGKLANARRILRFLMARGREFDVFNYYHDSAKNMLYALAYKLGNPGGKVYCKLDMSHLELELLEVRRLKFLPSLARRLKGLLSRMAVDFYSAETSAVYQRLSGDPYYAGRLHYIPNGIACPEGADIDRIMEGKERIILTVGSLGATAKNTELLVDAVALLPSPLISGWQVWLVGPLVNADFYETGFRESDHFKKYVEKVVEKHPHLEGTFVFTGPIDDPVRLQGIYGKAKIFCLTSRYESFGFVVPEAMVYGDYVIASDLPPVRDLTDNGRLGELFPAGNVQRLAGLLTAALEGEIDFASRGRDAHAFIMENYNWRGIVRKIDLLLS